MQVLKIRENNDGTCKRKVGGNVYHYYMVMNYKEAKQFGLNIKPGNVVLVQCISKHSDKGYKWDQYAFNWEAFGFHHETILWTGRRKPQMSTTELELMVTLNDDVAVIK